MKEKLLTILFGVLFITCFISCSKEIVIGEIKLSHNSKTDIYKLVYPEYNKIYPKEVKITFKKPKSIIDNINFTYNIVSDNTPLTLKLDFFQGGERFSYNLHYPYVHQDKTITLKPSDFTPAINTNKKMDGVYITMESKGGIDTVDTLSMSFKEMKVVEKERKKKRKKDEYNSPLLVFPESGQYALSNPPFIMFSKKLPRIGISISKNKDFPFEETITYTVRNYNFLNMTNTLENGKWYIRFEDNINTNNYQVFSFFIGDESIKRNNLEWKSFSNVRPFIFTDKTSLDVLQYFYNARRIDDTLMQKNMFAFKDYASSRVGRWSKNNILYQGEMRGFDNVLFNFLPSHTMMMSLYSYLNSTNSSLNMEVRNMVRDITELDREKIENFSPLDASVILANSVVMPFDLLYSSFQANELIRIKEALIKYGDTLYKYLIENTQIYRKKENIKYITTLALISVSMIGENMQEEKIREWYNFSLPLLDNIVFSSIRSDGSFVSSMGESFEILMPILQIAETLKSAGIVNIFEAEGFKKLGDYLSLAGYPSGYTIPFGNTSIERRISIRFDSGARSAVMELLAKNYNNSLYKNYAAFGVSDSVQTEYLPYMLIWNAYNVSANTPIRDLKNYKYGNFKAQETVIYNENIFTRGAPFLSIYAKGVFKDKSYNLNHNDRMSFVYYNYGDKIIDEAGFSYNIDKNLMTNIYSPLSHSIVNINTSYILDDIGTFSYIKTSTNDNNFLYVKAVAGKQFTYPEHIKDFSRRFYYIKPNTLIIKDNIEAMNDITKEFNGFGNIYTSRFTSKLPIKFDDEKNIFIIEGSDSITELYVVGEHSFTYNVESADIGEGDKIFSAVISTKEKVKSFSPWVIVNTRRKKLTPYMEKMYLENNLVVKNILSNEISFNYLYKNYNIQFNETNINTLYTEYRDGVIIISD